MAKLHFGNTLFDFMTFKETEMTTKFSDSPKLLVIDSFGANHF